MYAEYDIKDHEQCIGVFDKAQDVADYFEMSKHSVFSGRSKGCLIKQRYKVEKIEDEDIPEEESNPYCFNELIKEFMPEKHNFIEFDYFKDELKRRMNMIIVDEEWKQIETTNYSISNYGRVRNDKNRKVKSPRFHRWIMQTDIYVNGKRFTIDIPRITAHYFIREVTETERVTYIDGDRRNNYYKNLKIVNK